MQRLRLIKVLRIIDSQCPALNGSSLSILLPRLREQSERGDRKNIRARGCKLLSSGCEVAIALIPSCQEDEIKAVKIPA